LISKANIAIAASLRSDRFARRPSLTDSLRIPGTRRTGSSVL
jgi:hypothetical protein